MVVRNSFNSETRSLDNNINERVKFHSENIKKAQEYKQHVIDNWNSIDHKVKNPNEWINYYNSVISSNQQKINNLKPQNKKKPVFVFTLIVAILFFSYFILPQNQLTGSLIGDEINSPLENQIEFEILNPQSYPITGRTWQVNFKTKGTADLFIKASNGTTWSKNNETEDLLFLKIQCGSEILPYEWVDGGILIKNYSCNQTSHETVKVITDGKHTIEFRFGNLIAYANNNATNAPVIHAINLTTSYNSGENGTNENITVNIFSNDTEVPDNEVKDIIDWRLSGESIAILNMPFEGESNVTFTKDYGDYQSNGTVNGATNQTNTGFDGQGAYSFDGIDDFINISGFTTENEVVRSIGFWFKPTVDYDTTKGFVSLVNGDDYEIAINAGKMFFNFSGDTVYSTIDNWTSGNFFHIMTTVDINLKLYVNATLDNSTSVTPAYIIQNDTSSNVALFYSSGDIVLSGSCFTNSCGDPGVSPFIIQNATSHNTSFVNQTGGFCITDNNCNDQDLSCGSPNDGSFLIKDEVGTIVSYIDANGTLCLTGNLVQNN
ncbi:hypothetical protein HOK68_00040 [Candidatus Woesearchaeota archaeon]|nr:hypothetical protein [Candidatus Woesearchaeota archaeon]MBT4387824.1 hypothetical protein [Candidatus Woesearchaeota archaeon]MBT4595643.1 hypothetical protein [Candidatus Woesearchaeota archaeon]MBT5740874.1 hypothetical protein [Candidatus Woesearchaeota archaeon]MBT6505151.1 hypothetical protein [Candidatus Woesearchaeota archaeon]